MVTKNWNISHLDAVPNKETFANAVVKVHWVLTGTIGNTSAQTYGSSEMRSPSDDFIPYELLTKDMVLGWLHDQMGKDQIAEYEAGIDQQLDKIINPPTVVLPLPWVSANT